MKLIAVMFALAVSFIVSGAPARADPLPLLTFTSSGTITQGDDYQAAFFDTGGDLVGQKFTMTLTVDANTLPSINIGTDYSVHQNYTDTAVSWGEVTINGHTFSWRNDRSSSIVSRRNPADDWHGAAIDAWGIANNGLSVYASTNIYSWYNRFLNSTDITQPTAFDMDGFYMKGESYVSVYAPTGAPRGFVFIANQLDTAVWGVSPVPEPDAYAMMAAGLVLIVGLARRRSMR
nr:PEP-CTERM sorting domain-containing protein [uncultured Massilia sp.]